MGLLQKESRFTDGAAAKESRFTDGAAAKESMFTDGAAAKERMFTDGTAAKESMGLLQYSPSDTSLLFPFVCRLTGTYPWCDI